MDLFFSNVLSTLIYTLILIVVVFFITRSFYIKKIASLRLVDKFTGIYSRKYFDHVFLSDFYRARRIKHPISLVFIQTKPIKHVELALSSCIKRDTDFLACYDAGVYVAVLYDTDSAGSDNVVTRIENNIPKDIKYNIGVYAAIPDNHISSSYILSEALNTLKKAVSKGPNITEFSFQSV